MTDTTCWLHLVLFSLFWPAGIQPVTCSPTWMSRQFPCDVKVLNGSEIIFNCRSRGLKTVPQGITSNATVLDLSKNNIFNISNRDFSKLRNLTVLNLNFIRNGGGLTHIAADAFKELKNLHVLRLNGNYLSEVPSNLPSNLKRIELNNNNILLFDNKSFIGIRNVKQLSISKNCFYSNPCGKSIKTSKGSFSVMSHLQVLYLSFNNLTRVPKGLPVSLEKLYLQTNGIQHIFDDDFSELTNLKVLELQGNCPRCETAPYPCTPCPNISLNIDNFAFRNLRHLEKLHIGGNSLTTLKDSWFEKLNNLRELYLSFNLLFEAIVHEVKFLSYLPNVRKLDISFNFGHKTYPETIILSEHFSKLVSLRTLHLQGLVFKEIGPETLRPLYELKYLSALNLGTNFIVSFNSSIFSKLAQLKLIYLSENRLYPYVVNNPPHPGLGNNNMKQKLFTAPFIQPHLDFDFEVAHHLVKKECFDSGRVLTLSSNNLFFISPEQFKGYGDIACLNLSGNGFSAALNGTEFSLLPNLTYLDLSNNRIDLAYDNAFNELKKLQVLDISYNAHYFIAYGITHNLNFLRNLPVLRVLNMSNNFISTLTTKEMSSKSLNELQFKHNLLGDLWRKKDGSYDKLFMNLTNLTILDISFNHIAKIPKNVFNNLPHNLTELHISHNLLSNFDWPQLKCFNQLEILDLSFNHIFYVSQKISNFTRSLKRLDLSHNRISHLENGFLKDAKSLATILLNYNKLTVINQSTFLSKSENYMNTLYLHENPFHCTCDLFDFILWIEDSNVTIPKLETEVTCHTPDNTKGQPIILFDINQCVNNSEAFSFFILTSTCIVAIMVMTTLAHLFYWDVSYVLYYLKARLKGYRSLSSQEGSAYDVFVTYDTTDPQVSEWVREHLRVELEERGEKHLPLCLEERDWVPGLALVDNLTQSIQYSRKTLFVLTEAYVKTGSFRLAMYLAHQRLLDENLDVIVLLLLEPVLESSHFLRLRRRLCGKSVVEWPRTAAAIPWFWQNLRSVVRTDNQLMYNSIYSKYFSAKQTH